MSYSLSNYTVRITSSSQLQVVTRNGESVQKTVDLSQTDGKIFLVDEDDFDVIGTNETTGEYLSQIDPADNDVTLSTAAELLNLGGGASIELEVFNAYLSKNAEGGVSFYEADIDSASVKKAA